MRMRSTLVAAALTAATAAPLSAQTARPAIGPANGGAEGAASIPDFSGHWARVSFPGFEPPLTGPGPVTNRLRARNGAASVLGYVGDYTNPILKPHAAEIVKKRGEIELGGAHAPIRVPSAGPVAYRSFLRTLACRCCRGETRSRFSIISIINTARCD